MMVYDATWVTPSSKLLKPEREKRELERRKRY
jgi:hypothetical protein